MNHDRVTVAVPGAPYDVVIATGCLTTVGHEARQTTAARRAVIVTDRTVGTLYGDSVATSLRDAGLDVSVLTVPAGEAAKTLATVTELYSGFAAMPLERSDVVVAVGGGVVGDMAGFAAATWHRGIDLIQVPTTVLAQVDSAIGGKTGVNLPEGKNLVGAFHQPRAVIADVDVLASLPERERRAGLGEVVKYGFIADPEILVVLEREAAAVVGGNQAPLLDLVRRSVAVKADVVAADERESGHRALLNYGHTFGHAIETLTGYDAYRHGEAVAIGMVAAARLSERLGIAGRGLAHRTESLLRAVGLPTGGVALPPERVWDALARDKKARGGVRFVVCAEPGRAMVIDEPDRRVVDEVVRSLA